MTYFHPAWLEHQRQRYLRADAYRFAAPGTPEAKPPGWLDPSATRVRLKEAQEAEARRQAEAAQEEFERKLLEVRWLVKSLRTDLLMLDLRHKYSPNQPRDELGRWTSGANSVGDAAAADTQDESGCGEVRSDASSDPNRAGDQFANVIRICMLGTHSISTDAHGNQRWWADYTCADGFTFRKFGTGGKVRGFWVDTR